MKTSVIRYRVADFLRQHPPFDTFSLADLLTFSGTGRVLFHEDDIYLFRKGQVRDAQIWVIQQGRIELLDETPSGERLYDLLSPGDILGLPYENAAVHPLTARTMTEVILYSFDAVAFDTLAQEYPQALHYLAAHLSTTRQTKALQAPSRRNCLMSDRERLSWLNAKPTRFREPPVTCTPEVPMREAMTLLAGHHGRPIAVVSADRRLLGLLTESTALRAAPDSPVGMCLNGSFQASPPGLQTSEYFLRMLSSRCRTLAVTTHGGPDDPLESVITDSDLAIDCSRNPTLFQRAMLAARSLEELAYLRERAGAFLAEEMVGPSVVEWFWRMKAHLDAALIERIVTIAEDEMATIGQFHPGQASCWIALGSAGRRELLDGVFELGLVYVDPPPEGEEQSIKYFSALAQMVDAKLRACGFPALLLSPGSVSSSLSAWKMRYADLILDPIGRGIYNTREWFDLHFVSGDSSLVQSLQEAISIELNSQQSFLRVLANDTLAHLPPLTLFESFVIGADGEATQSVDLERVALRPLSDAARVFSIASGDLTTTNTMNRLESSTRTLPQYGSIFRDALDAMRIACYQQTIAALSARGDDVLVQPASLGRFEQRLLKSSFDAIRRLLELTGTIHS